MTKSNEQHLSACSRCSGRVGNVLNAARNKGDSLELLRLSAAVADADAAAAAAAVTGTAAIRRDHQLGKNIAVRGDAFPRLFNREKNA